MANIGVLYGNYRTTYSADWELLSQNIENNTSTIRLYATFYTGNGTTIASSYSNFTLDGQTVRSGAYSKTGSGNIFVESRDITVAHNSDGTFPGRYVSFSTNDYIMGNQSGGGTIWDVPTIPRASSVSATDCGLGDNTTITINRASGNFTHNLTYNFGSLNGTIANNVGTSYTWTTPMNFASQMPNAKSGICTVTCVTYSGGTQIGTTTTTFRVTVEEEYYKPQISGNIVDINQATINLTGDATVLVTGYSIASISYNAQALASATISKITINNSEVSESPTTMTARYNSYELVATDSRGYKGSITLRPEIVSYIGLTISAEFARIAPTTGEVGLSFSGNYFDDTFGAESNTLTLEWDYKLKSDTNWTTGGTLVKDIDYIISDNKFHSGTGNYESVISLGNTYNYQESYDFRIRYADKLIDRTISQTVPKGQPIANWDDEKFNVNGIIKRNETEFAKNSYNTSQNDTYSCDYLNTNFQSSYILYDSTATTGDVDLSSSSRNFNYIEIFYRYRVSSLSQYVYSSTRIYSPYNKIAGLTITVPSTSDYNLAMATVEIGNLKITKKNYGLFYYGAYANDNVIQIYRVTGSR